MRWLENLGKESKSLTTIQAHFLEMLERGAEAYRHGFESLFDPDGAAGRRAALDAAETRTDELMQAIRRELVVHGTVHGSSTFPDLLVLMSLAKDAERIGDYAVHLMDLALLRPNLGDEDEVRALQLKGATLLELLEQGRRTFEEGDEAEARAFLERVHELEEECEAAVTAGVLRTQGNAAARVLALRHFKRVARHLGNIVSSVVLPLDQLDRFDE
jgi:phosphate transport system protein